MIKWRNIITYALLIILVFVILYPVYYTAMTSFKSKVEYLKNRYFFPKIPTIENFVRLFQEGDIIIWMKNSIILTTFSVIICTFISSLAAFALAKMEFKGKNFLFGMIVPMMIFPPIILLIPLFYLMTRIHLFNTYYGPILIYIGIYAPFSTYLLTSFFVNIPSEMLDAAKIDGCSMFKVYLYILLPQSKPALITIALVNGLYVWNDLLIGMTLLQKNSLKPLTVGLVLFQSRYSLDAPVKMAGATISALLPLIIYLFAQKFFTRGLTAGVVK